MGDDVMCADGPGDDVVQLGPPGKVLVQVQHDEVAVLVVAREDGKFSVWWFDYVVNEHEETFDELSVAVARVAVLMRCAEDDWESSFSDDAESFAVKARAFLDAAVSTASSGSAESLADTVQAFLDDSVS